MLATESLLSLAEDAISGAKIASHLPTLAVTRLPLYFQQGNGLVCSQLALLWYSLNPFICEPANLCLLELLPGKFYLSPPALFFLSGAIPQFGLPSYVSSFRLSLEHSGLVLKHATHAS